MRIGIDLGGSHIGVGIIDEEKIIDKIDTNFNRENRKNIKETIINTIKSSMDDLLRRNNCKIDDIELIGLAVPGTISNGVIVKAGNLNVRNYDILAELSNFYSIPFKIRNDGKCAAIAEKKYGALQNYDDCLFINIGTGIGGAVFMGGKLLEPKRYSGFEFGHMVLNKGGRQCTCGKQGCFETYSSIKSLKMKITQTLDIDSDISGKELKDILLNSNDPRIKEDINVFLEYLKTGIANLIDIFEPEAICFGGSFSYYENNYIFDELMNKLKCENATFNNDLPEMVFAKLRNDAGIIGAVVDNF